MVGPVTTATTAWMDRWWDDDAGLLWNPPGSFEGVVEPRSVHLVRETAWYAIGLLRRDGPGDRARAEAALDAVVGHQYDEPGQPWHGTFVRFPEWAASHGGRDRVDRLRPELAPVPRHRARGGHHRLRPARPASPRGPATPSTSPWTRSRRTGSRRPTRTSPCSARGWTRGRVEPTTGTPAPSSTPSGVTGCFTEYGSPTYYGIDLLALGLWQRPRRSRRAATRRRGGGGRPVGRHRPLVARRAREPVRPVLAGLRHGPRLLRERPLPRAVVRGPARSDAIARRPTSCRTATTCAWPRCSSTSACGCRRRFGPPSSASTAPTPSDQVIEDSPRREATGWLEDAPADRRRGRRRPGSRPGASSTPRRCTGASPTAPSAGSASSTTRPTRARPSERRLVVECDLHPARGAQPVRWVTNTTPVEVGADRWRLPGLTVDVTTDAVARAIPRRCEYRHSTAEPASSCDLTPDHLSNQGAYAPRARR